MSNAIQLIVGLANPGPEYSNTRHNAGEWYVQALADKFGISLSPDKKAFGLVGSGFVGQNKVHLLIPTTFMNRSGQSVAALANFYRITPEQILVAHDELDIDPGVCKIKLAGGHGGHNGLRDIISRLGNNNGFYRLRIGIGHPGHKDRVTGHVLGKPSSEDRQRIDASIDEAVRATETWLKDDLKKAQHQLHSFKAN